MGLLFTVPEPIPPKPRLVIQPGPAGLHMLSGAELSQGHPRAAERIASLAETLREKTTLEGWA